MIEADEQDPRTRGPSRKGCLPQVIASFTGVTVGHSSGASGQADRAFCGGIPVI
jgi:hypothetical protein